MFFFMEHKIYFEKLLKKHVLSHFALDMTKLLQRGATENFLQLCYFIWHARRHYPNILFAKQHYFCGVSR